MENYWKPEEGLSAEEESTHEFYVPIRLYVGVVCTLFGLIFYLLVQ